MMVIISGPLKLKSTKVTNGDGIRQLNQIHEGQVESLTDCGIATPGG
jgi:hypothetical protein